MARRRSTESTSLLLERIGRASSDDLGGRSVRLGERERDEQDGAGQRHDDQRDQQLAAAERVEIAPGLDAAGRGKRRRARIAPPVRPRDRPSPCRYRRAAASNPPGARACLAARGLQFRHATSTTADPTAACGPADRRVPRPRASEPAGRAHGRARRRSESRVVAVTFFLDGRAAGLGHDPRRTGSTSSPRCSRGARTRCASRPWTTSGAARPPGRATSRSSRPARRSSPRHPERPSRVLGTHSSVAG